MTPFQRISGITPVDATFMEDECDQPDKDQWGLEWGSGRPHERHPAKQIFPALGKESFWETRR